MKTSLREIPLDEARRFKALRESTQAPRTPLRFRPVIVHGPGEGYCLVDLGFALANELPVVR